MDSQDNKGRVQRGSELASETNEKLLKVSMLINKILISTDSLAIANQEQSKNLAEINSVIENLSKATQESARTSEESSSASLELSRQSLALQNLVNKLEVILIGRESKKALARVI